MRTSQRLAGIASAVAMVVTLSSCGSSSSDGGTDTGNGAEGSPASGGELVMGIRSNPVSLDSTRCASTNFPVCNPIYGSLLRYNLAEEKFDPALAESFESTDGKKWTLKLKPGITFTDGTPYDAEAVIFNWERAKDPAALSPALYWVGQIADWKVVDPTTVEINLNAANYQFPWALQYELGAIGSPTAIKAAGDAFGTKPVGAGAFTLKDWVPNSQLTFTKNADYIEEGLPHADSLTLKIVAADDARVNALRAGEINLNSTFLNRDAKTLESEGFPVQRMQLWGGTALAFNMKDPVVSDPDLHTALLHALNAAQTTNALYAGELVPEGYFRTDSPYFDDSSKYPAFDLAAAQKSFDAYLAKAGKQSLELDFLTYAEYPILAQVSEMMQQQLNSIEGLKINLKPLGAQELITQTRTGKFQLAMANAAGSQNPDSLYRAFHSKGDMNITGYSNPTVDGLLEKVRQSNDAAELKAAYTEFGSILSKDAPYRFFAQENDIVIGAKNVGGINGVNLGAVSFELAWVK